ncbi:MAG: hypothetical protein QXI16_05705 [Sulfolobaceae archaeon]
MNELELLEQLQTIKNKLDNDVELTDHEYKIFTSVMFVAIMGVAKWSFNLVLKVMEGDKK